MRVAPDEQSGNQPDEHRDPWRHVAHIRPDWQEYERRKRAIIARDGWASEWDCKAIAREMGL